MKDLKDYDNVLRIRCRDKKVAWELSPMFAGILQSFELIKEQDPIKYKNNLIMLNYYMKEFQKVIKTEE